MARPLKILHILDHSLPLYSGYTFRSQSILKAQIERGWTPIAVTSAKHEENWRGAIEEKESIGGVTYYRTGPVPMISLPLRRELRIMSVLYRRIRAIVDVERPDILHAHSPVLNALPALLAGRRLGIPVVYEVRALWEDAAVDHGTYAPGSWKYNAVRRLETWACRQADHLAVLCQGIKEEMVKRHVPATRITVVPNAINPEEFVPNGQDGVYRDQRLEGKRVIGFIGSFYRYEGLDLLIHAMAQLAATRSDVVLLLVGAGEVEDELKAQVKQFNLDKVVLMPGKLGHDEVYKVYAIADVLVYPRHSIRLTEMVTPLKPLEAMAMGRAVVASDIGGHRELIRHGSTGLLVAPESPSELAGAINRILDDSALRERLGRQAASWVREERCWDKVAGLYREVYRTALKKTRHSEEEIATFFNDSPRWPASDIQTHQLQPQRNIETR